MQCPLGGLFLGLGSDGERLCETGAPMCGQQCGQLLCFFLSFFLPSFVCNSLFKLVSPQVLCIVKVCATWTPRLPGK